MTRRLAVAWSLLATICVLAGCGKQSPLNPEGPPAHDIDVLWWWMLLAAAIVFFGAIGLIGLAAVRRRRKGLPLLGEDEGYNRRLVVGFGIVIPILALVPLFIVANLSTIHATAAPSPSSTRMTVHVIGHQWFWEVRYPGTAAVTANEIHIPTRTRVNIVATTGDVIHSLWVPQLNRKIDMINGRLNRILWYADKPGVYRGQCAEFCGLQHAHMGLKVLADPPARFRTWLANMARPRRPPQTAGQMAGERVFQSEACASCHAIRGTPARGTVGPDLTHLATRTTLAALTIANTPGRLRDWIRDPQSIKPGAKMPALGLSPQQIQSLVTYLESLR